MAIREMWGFDHLPPSMSTGVSETGWGLAYNGYGLVARPHLPLYNTILIGWTGTPGSIGLYNSGSYALGANIDALCSRLTDGVSTKSYFGLRLMQSKASPVAKPGVILINGIPVILSSDLSKTYGTYFYYEVCIDRVSKEITIWIDGIFIRKYVAQDVVDSYNGSTLFTLTNESVAGGYDSWRHFRDFYFIDDTRDDTPCSRLGPITVSPITVAAATGVNWTTAQATLALTVNRPLNSVSALTDYYANSAAVPTELACTLALVAPANALVKAVALLSTAKKDVGSDTAFSTQLRLNAGVVNWNKIQFPDNNNLYSAAIGVFNKTPDNAAWTPANVNQTVLAMMPVTAG